MADKQRKIELLAPAGNWERFVTAIQFGADAVYLGTTAFSLRNLRLNRLRRPLDMRTNAA